jgi:GH15 family glucan-1,4-alpha-glucosidase
VTFRTAAASKLGRQTGEVPEDAKLVLPIESYGIIGDLHTIALVGTNGSIDFLCFPHFDSPSVFAALLDPQRGGRFQIEPELNEARTKQLYLPGTNVLLTRFLSDAGVAEITDFMPVREVGLCHAVLRRVRGVRGDLRFRMRCDPRFDYGRAERAVESSGREVVFRSRGPDGTALRLRADVPLRVADGVATAEFRLRAGETVDFVLEDANTRGPEELPIWCARTFDATVQYWRRWIGRSQYRGRWREMVHRSALVLKLLTSDTHGSMVAAPTFGLPEEIGGVRNWDYRYTWIRDAAFTTYALLRLGFTDEARHFMRWIEARCGEAGADGSLQIMYALDGRKELGEETLGHLCGYRNSRPVRIGNGAAGQLQLDIYGELMDAVYLYDKYAEPVSFDLWTNLVRLVDWVCEHWRRPDEGIWEVRGGQQEFLYSRLLCWVAIDRGVRLAWKRSLPAPLQRWISTRSEIHQEIVKRFYDPKRQAFVQHAGSKTLDASSLLMPLVRFIGPTDPRWLSTLAAIERELVDDSLVFRYRVDAAASDGLAGEEGTFNLCSFWYVECLSRAGRLDEARLTFEKMLGYASPLGLYAEELARSGEQLGNFPQAFTHLALISAAYDLDRRLSEAGWHA